MATARKQEVEVPQPPVVEQRIVLELTEVEARAVLTVLGKIGGSPETEDKDRKLTLRYYTSQVWAALVRAGIHEKRTDTYMGTVYLEPKEFK